MISQTTIINGMASRRSVGGMAFLIPLVLGAMASGWVPLLRALEGEFDVSRTTLGLASLGGLAGGLAARPLVDWQGPRLLMVVGGLAAALGLLILSMATSLPVLTTGGFLANAGAGLAGGIVVQVLVARWFVRYRGLYLGLAILGAGLSFHLFPPVIGMLEDAGGWRLVARVLALLGAVVSVAALTFVRSHPETGQEDDPSDVRVSGRRSPRLECEVPVGRYIRSPGLWPALALLGVAMAGVLLVKSGLSVMAGWVVSETTGSGSALDVTNTLFGIGIAVGGLGWSAAADFWSRHRLMWSSYLATAAALICMVAVAILSSPGVIGLWPLLFLAGIFLGGLGALMALTFIDYVGVRLLGTLSLVVAFLSGVGGASGPLIFGLMIDVTGIPLLFPLAAVILTLATWMAASAPYPRVYLERGPKN